MVLQNDVKYDVIDGTKRRQSETSLTIQNDVIDAKNAVKLWRHQSYETTSNYDVINATKRRQTMTSSKLQNSNVIDV